MFSSYKKMTHQEATRCNIWLQDENSAVTGTCCHCR